jgi:DNA-directed RNA polymerase specialized sigma24 family protein
MTVRESSSEHWDEAKFRAVFLQHYARIVAMLMCLLGDLALAEEVANDAFWRLFRQPGLQVDGNVGGWLYRTATNLGIDALRASGRRRRYEGAAGGARHQGGAAGPLDDRCEKRKLHRPVGVEKPLPCHKSREAARTFRRESSTGDIPSGIDRRWALVSSGVPWLHPKMGRDIGKDPLLTGVANRQIVVEGPHYVSRSRVCVSDPCGTRSARASCCRAISDLYPLRDSPFF